VLCQVPFPLASLIAEIEGGSSPIQESGRPFKDWDFLVYESKEMISASACLCKHVGWRQVFQPLLHHSSLAGDLEFSGLPSVFFLKCSDNKCAVKSLVWVDPNFSFSLIY